MVFHLSPTFHTYHALNDDYPAGDNAAKSDDTTNSRETNVPTKLVHETAIHSTWRGIVFEFIKIKGDRTAGAKCFFSSTSSLTSRKLSRITEKDSLIRETITLYASFHSTELIMSLVALLEKPADRKQTGKCNKK